MLRLAAIEGGGTTWVVGICEGDPTNITARKTFKTESPEKTLTAVREYLIKQAPIHAIGIASFGPVQANKNQEKYGHITTTPKLGWKDTNVLRLLGIHDEFNGIPFLFDTDVNAPALAEYCYLSRGSAISSSAYITLGTGVGVGLVINGKTVHGMMHPEGGHLMVQRLPGDTFEGSCPFHKTCIEGLCSTGALVMRKGCRIEDLPGLAGWWFHMCVAGRYNFITVCRRRRALEYLRVLHRTAMCKSGPNSISGAHQSWWRCDGPGGPFPTRAAAFAGHP